MDPSKKDDEAARKESGKEARKDDESKREDEDDSDNQLDDESKDEMVKRGAVGRRFAVVDLPALEQLAAGDAAK